LQHEKDGIKANPIHLTDCGNTDSEIIGKHIINLYQTWKPKDEEQVVQKIGSLYGFDLYLRRQREAYEERGLFEYRYFNTFYAQRLENGIKYTYSNGIPNIDNPKLAARHFLNAIDRVEGLKEKYQKKLQELEHNIPMVEQMANRPFEKEGELMQMKSDLSGLEREITINIQKNQMKQNAQAESEQETIVIKETPVIQMIPKEESAKQIVMEKANGFSVNSREVLRYQSVQEPGMRRSNRLRF
jgi:hypothetical protein